MMCARSVIRSSSALHSRALGITCVHSEKGRLVVTMTAAFSARSAITWNTRGKESIRASGGIVMVGNFDVDVEQQQRIGHLLSPLPPEMRNDTAFMDRIHAYAPGWDFPKLKADEHLTDHFGLVTDYLSECWTKLREGTRISALQGRAHWGGALSGRDIEAVSKTVSGLLKLLFPNPEMPMPDQELEAVLRIALEARRQSRSSSRDDPSVNQRRPAPPHSVEA